MRSPGVSHPQRTQWWRARSLLLPTGRGGLLIVPADADEDGAMLSPLGGRYIGGVVTARIGHDEPEGHFDYGITGRG
jgi:hypothetical protein